MISNMDSVEDEQPQIVTTTMSSTILKGDVNCDTEVDMSDAVLIMQALANPNKYGIDGTAENHLTEQGKLNGDMDGDGLTVGDAQEIQKKLLGLEDCTYVQYEKNIDWYYANLPSGVYEKCIGNGKSDVITTTDELKAYIYQFAPEEAVISYLEKYNDSFFKDNVLLIDSVNQTEGAVVGYVFDNVEITDKEINITIKKALSDWEAAPDLMSLCIFQISVSKMSYNGQAVNWKK
ncbi:dockerin type I repeat-containing protein [Ruminococcus sp.]|uniref:dockerin type I repeat-containing protein n=1 Tax=Ruminococcus sp. TaxID=41978 RepID=UPI0025CF784A|nr:dockerin type I repeat-containing protein [Ruminococcus sp.]